MEKEECVTGMLRTEEQVLVILICGYTINVGVFFSFLAMPCSMPDLPQPEIKPMLPALGMRSLNHWTARKIPMLVNFNCTLQCTWSVRSEEWILGRQLVGWGILKNNPERFPWWECISWGGLGWLRKYFYLFFLILFYF